MLFSPPSIVKSALGVSGMMMDNDMDPLDIESAQVQPVNQYYFSNHLPNLNQHHAINHNYHQAPLSSNILSHQSIIQQQRQSQQLRSFDRLQQQQTPLNNNTNNNSNLMYHSTPVASSSVVVAGSSYSVAANNNNSNNNAMVRLGNATTGVVDGSSSRLAQRSLSSVAQYDKENLANDDHFIMLRHEDELDLGGFQMSKSIFGQNLGGHQQQQAQQLHHQRVVMDSNSSSMNNNMNANGSKLRTFGNNQHPNNGGGGYFGFDRTNLMQNNQGSSSRMSTGIQKSPMKLSNNYNSSSMGMAPKVDGCLDVYAGDSNSQASLPTTVSSPASTVSYFDQQGSSGGNQRPIMEFLDVNDDYWLEFAQ